MKNMKYFFLNDPKYKWSMVSINNLSVYYIGRVASINKIVTYLKSTNEINIKRLKKIVNELFGNFAFVVVGQDLIFSAVDRVCGYRLFYKYEKNNLYLSNSARLLIKAPSSVPEINQTSILEVEMSGYVSGRNTIIKNLYKIQAGEFLSAQKSGHFVIDSYFEFYSSNVRHEKESNLIDELDYITNKIILRNIEDANGNVIWVPLSGGLDSRFVLSKLKENKYDNIRTYSYGYPGNFDALRAKEIASRLSVPWTFIQTTDKDASEYFHSDKRKEFWEYADGLHVVPNLHGMFALNNLIKKDKVHHGDVIINGQTGDFITGQHTPTIPNNIPLSDTLFEVILNKHYSQRLNLLNKESSKKIMKDIIGISLGSYLNPSSKQDLVKSYEYWEWKERQVNRVVNGQMNYDYFGIEWQLPLWDKEYVKFWSEMPISLKENRKLFVNYLNKTNPCGVFKNFNPGMSRWPRSKAPLLYLGRLISLVGGKGLSSVYYKRLDYYSQYRYLYACTGYDMFKENYKNYKGPLPYFADVWIKENLEKILDCNV
jgi:asparagine synthase (glutamine-hydrolysing)